MSHLAPFLAAAPIRCIAPGKRIIPGARVRWSRDFLRAIGKVTGHEMFDEGLVLAIDGDQHWKTAVVEWDGGTITRVLPINLSITGVRESEAREWSNARVEFRPAARKLSEG